MSQVQKTTAAAIACAITLVGATFVSAPLTLPDSQQVVAHAHQWSTGHLHRIAVDLRHAAVYPRA
jgi:hypothetical protein